MGCPRRAKLFVAAISVMVAMVAVAGSARGRPLEPRVVAVGCEAPRTLHLERYEDGSARLLCNGRLLVRVSVPW